MTKIDEFDNPNSCFSKAKPMERMFILLTRDIVAPEVIRHWVKLRIKAGKNKAGDAQTREALACAALMEMERPLL